MRGRRHAQRRAHPTTARSVGTAAVAALVVAIAAPASAATRQDGALWVVNQIAVPFDATFSFHVMTQHRILRDLDRYERTVVRPWIRTALPHGFAVSLGYDAHLVENPRATEEHRAWQRIELRREFGAFTGFGHFWLEERFFGGEDVAWRSRIGLGASLDLTERLQLVASNEFLVDLNETPTIRDRGLGDDRFVLGLSHRVAAGLRLNAGYMLRYLDLSPDLFEHTATIGFSFATPVLSELFRAVD